MGYQLEVFIKNHVSLDVRCCCSGQFIQSKPFCGGKWWGFFLLVVCLLEEKNLEFLNPSLWHADP